MDEGVNFASGVVETITGYTPDIISVGVAVMGVVVLIKGFGWIKTAMGR